ncbi:DUF2793 domain-containing protein [Albidovulum sp.]|uniref:DUF2793 domain-containing protein n=1 Tax=Albidovulum sp. TaxID=1872424 RepID=UPI0039B998AC
MSDITTHLLLPYILASQAQKHVTHNEALRLLDAMVQLSVLDRDLTAPPVSPADGDRHLVASGATGIWAGWDLNVAFWIDGVWMRLVPRPGWLAWIADEAVFVVWNGTSWEPVGGSSGGTSFAASAFELHDDADPTKIAQFHLSGISTGTTRTFTLPNTSSELAILAGTQTFTGDKAFSGALTASGAIATIGTAAGTATYGLGTGATTTGLTKTLNLGTGGDSGSTTVVNIGSDNPGAGGTTVINTPTVTFANAVTEVGMPQANLTAQLLGLGGAMADSYNRLSVNTPAVLLNNAGAGIEATVNKAAPANDAAFAFKTGFSARALFGLLGSDDVTLKVSPDGTSYFDALIADRATGRISFPAGVALSGLAADPASPADGWLWHNAATGQLRTRVGGMTRILADQDVPWLTPVTGDYALSTTGAGGAATGTLAGAANRMDIFPFIPRDDLTLDRLAVNVTTLIAGALGKIVVYSADATGRPASLLLETADLDFSTAGVKSATVALTLRRGITLWLGIRHSSTPTLSAWASTATPDLNGGSPVTTARKVLRRTLAYATAAPVSWSYLASETNAGPGTAIWMRAA